LRRGRRSTTAPCLSWSWRRHASEGRTETGGGSAHGRMHTMASPRGFWSGRRRWRRWTRPTSAGEGILGSSGATRESHFRGQDPASLSRHPAPLVSTSSVWSARTGAGAPTGAAGVTAGSRSVDVGASVAAELGTGSTLPPRRRSTVVRVPGGTVDSQWLSLRPARWQCAPWVAGSCFVPLAMHAEQGSHVAVHGALGGALGGDVAGLLCRRHGSWS